MTHRVAGPLVRLERIVRQMARGERVAKVTLRPNDMLGQFVDALNELVETHNRKLEEPLYVENGGQEAPFSHEPAMTAAGD
jgi:HAMP domain-containing protein